VFVDQLKRERCVFRKIHFAVLSPGTIRVGSPSCGGADCGADYPPSKRTGRPVSETFNPAMGCTGPRPIRA
jgi:hypothetical protein